MTLKSITAAALLIATAYTSSAQHPMGLVVDTTAWRKVQHSAVMTRDVTNNLPKAVSIQKWAPAIGNQGQIPSCTAWAVTWCGATICWAQRNGVTDRATITKNAMLPALTYYYISNGNCSIGTVISEGAKFLVDKGSVPYSTPGEKCCFGSAPSHLLAAAAKNKITSHKDLFSYYNPQGYTSTITATKKALAEGHPVIIGMNLPQSFMNCNTADYAPTEAIPGYANVGGHAMCVIAYDDNRNGGSFLLQNSWGTSWGKNGYVWIKYNLYAWTVTCATEIVAPMAAGSKVDLTCANINYDTRGALMDCGDNGGGGEFNNGGKDNNNNYDYNDYNNYDNNNNNYDYNNYDYNDYYNNNNYDYNNVYNYDDYNNNYNYDNNNYNYDNNNYYYDYNDYTNNNNDYNDYYYNDYNDYYNDVFNNNNNYYDNNYYTNDNDYYNYYNNDYYNNDYSNNDYNYNNYNNDYNQYNNDYDYNSNYNNYYNGYDNNGYYDDSYDYSDYNNYNFDCGSTYRAITPKGDTVDVNKFAGNFKLMLSDGKAMPGKINGKVIEMDGSYKGGTRFRIFVGNNQPAYVYVFGTDLTNKMYNIFPLSRLISPLLEYHNSRIALPDENHWVEMDNNIGTDYLYILYSIKPLNIPVIMQKMEEIQGNYETKLFDVLGNKTFSLKECNTSGDGLFKFNCNMAGKTTLGVVVKFNHIK
jgi:hypothetical protein